MALEIVGKLIKILPEVSGQSQKGAWSKQEFVLETLEAQYPKKVCLTAWGDKVADLKSFNLDDTIKATFSAESREYNERWYTELRAFRIEAGEGGGGGAAPAYSRPAPQQSSAPAAQTRSASSPMPFSSSFDEETNDLPF
ncbi:MAG: DUF3127 domain-containing protein [Cytophagales bacterium]|nr:MAG: DUF3127 domain-containing protein [Cytophagales bacterium]